MTTSTTDSILCSSGTTRVLLVDDHAILREGVKALLGAARDIEVVGEARDGSEALQLASDLAPDVIVMDITMPRLNGIDAIRLLRARQIDARVLMLTMHATSEHVHRALAAGADGYLVKDAASVELVTAVRTVYRGQAFFSSAIAGQARAALLGGAAEGPINRLSAREVQVLQLVAEGNTSSEAAKLVHLSPKTIETYRSRIMKKIGVANVAGLVKFAVAHGLTT